MTRAEPVGRGLSTFASGETATRDWTVRLEDVQAFARLTGDSNPLHLSEAFGAQTIFGGMNAHGMYVASLIVGVVGSTLPGAGWFCHSLDKLNFLRPVRVGDRLRISVKVTQIVRATQMLVLEGSVTNQAEERVVSAQIRAQVALPRQDGAT